MTKITSSEFSTPCYLTKDAQYGTWAQDKCFSYNGIVYALYNEGTSHISNDLKVMMKKSDDKGSTWSSAQEIFYEAGWSGGCTAWGAGVDKNGVFWIVVRKRGADYLIGHTVHILLTSSNLGQTWQNLGEVAVNNGVEVPILFHSFAELGDGTIAFGYHFNDGEVGIVKYNGTAWAKKVMLTDSVMVEPTIFYDKSNNVALGFLRTQDTNVSNIKFWRSTDNCNTFTIENTDVAVPFAPVPIIDNITEDTYYALVCERYNYDGNGAKMTILKGNKDNVLSQGWPAFTKQNIGYIDAIAPSGTTGAGVPSVAKCGGIMWFVSEEKTLNNPDILYFVQDKVDDIVIKVFDGEKKARLSTHKAVNDEQGLKIMTLNGVYAFDLVNTTDNNASAIKIQTNIGVQCIKQV
jgi:hypothetical protein